MFGGDWRETYMQWEGLTPHVYIYVVGRLDSHEDEALMFTLALVQDCQLVVQDCQLAGYTQTIVVGW